MRCLMKKKLIIALSCVAVLAVAFGIWMLADREAYISVFRPNWSRDFVSIAVLPIRR